MSAGADGEQIDERLDDDPTIDASVNLVRRIWSKNPDMVWSDSATGERHPTTAAFKIDPDGVSVFRADVLADHDIPLRAVAPADGQSLVSFTVGEARACSGLGVINDPDPEEDGVGTAHSLVRGWPPLSRRQRKEHQRAIAMCCSFVLES